MKHRLLRLAAAAAILFLLITAFAAPRLGRWLVREDALVKADAIFVLGGSRFERPLEAVDLHKAGWAPTIVLVDQAPDWGEIWLRRRGTRVPSDMKVQMDVLEQLGVPRSALTSVGPAGSTADEADELLAIMTARGWSSVIVVTSKQHTRRAGLAIRRVVGADKTVIVRASRYDRSNVDRWWASRSTVRFTLFEAQRLVAYWIGVAD